MDRTASRGDVVLALGEPRRASSGSVLYDAEPGFVQFDFVDETLTMVVVMRRDLGA